MRALAVCCVAGLAAGLVAGAAITLMGPGAAARTAQPIRLGLAGVDLGAAHDLLDADLLDDPFDGVFPGQVRAYIDYVLYEVLKC